MRVAARPSDFGPFALFSRFVHVQTAWSDGREIDERACFLSDLFQFRALWQATGQKT